MTPSRSEDLKIELLDTPAGVRVIRVTGPLTLRTLFDFQAAARAESTRPVVVDISGSPYMDSAGLGAVISIFASCQRTNRGFGIIGVSHRIHTLFQVTHVDGLLPCFDSLEAAEGSITSK